MSDYMPDPDLDLVLERTVPVPPDRVWAAWTEPELLVQWFTPAPWKTVASDLDVRPGGRCITTMESPEGEQYPNVGCYLQVEPERLLVFTSVMIEEFRPAARPSDGMPFTARVEITPPPTAGPTTGPSPCTPTRPAAAATPRWGSTRAGAPPSTSSSPSSADGCGWVTSRTVGT